MYVILNVANFLIVIAGFIAGPILVALALALWLPLAFLWKLTSAIWTGEFQSSMRAGSPEKSDDDASGSEPEPEGERRDADVANEAPASGSKGFLIGWKSHPDRNVALRSYYFGPMVDDMANACRAMVLTCAETRETLQDWAENAADVEMAFVRLAIPFSLIVGSLFGFLLGIGAAVVVGLVYAVASLICLAVALCLSFVLRSLDSACCFIAGIARTCWTCGENVLPYPHYLCPDCGELHRDIKPGPYGVARRICKCERRLWTMLLTGAAKLQGICPRCGAYLPRKFGRAAEIVVPIFGATNVGKTRLMYMMVSALRDRVHSQHGKIVYIGDASERLDVIEDALKAGQNVEKTVPGPARALGLHVKIGSSNRLIYFFDAAGEMYSSHERLPELKYLNKAKTYVFVVDPFSAKGVWSQLTDADRDRLREFRTPPGDIDKAYQATINHMLKITHRWKLRKARSNLAFVISKRDLLQSAGIDVSAAESETEHWVSNEGGLNLGNISRGASHEFETVRYFCTAATSGDGDGSVDYRVEELLRWILGRVGVRIGA
jgi:hypothetical protein